MPIDPNDNRYAANVAIADLTATAGVADNTLVDVGATFDQAIVNNNFRDLAAKVNAVLAALRESSVISEG